ncbi:universal stress protein [Chelativorans intermedius]|uniref:Universal stress protein n=1 Tax=Chelativorans intermedius TaxID=515947 RepID=A0ABV6DCV1_9HYPH|nr:universal stress protein [Chelativorans intermedius]MCT9000511.1 universal stress protein [Chelativorans intermedius]
MTVKVVLSVIGVEHSDDDLSLAIELCRQAEAHLVVLVLSLAPPPPVSEYAAVMTESWLEERQAEIDRLGMRLKEIRAILAESGLSAEADGEYVERSWTDDMVGRRGRYADVTLIGPEMAADDELKTMVLKGSLYISQIPVLLTPQAAGATLTPKRILLAWDGRSEATRAMREALDLLAAAEEVHVTMVDPRAAEDGLDIEPGADVAAYLARHGAKVVVDRLPSGGRPVAQTLRRHAVDMAADMIVMGAYSHSRLRERIFGGVTRSMIEETDLPVFMAH